MKSDHYSCHAQKLPINVDARGAIALLEYKGLKDGVEVVAVPPAYTSQTCHQCLHIGLRSDKKFKCGNCGLSCDAD